MHIGIGRCRLAQPEHPHQRIERDPQVLVVHFGVSVYSTLATCELGWINVEVLLSLPNNIFTQFGRRKVDT